MNSCPGRDQLQDFLAETLPSNERSSLETHVEDCLHCQQTLARLTEDSLLLPSPPGSDSAPTPLFGLRGQQERCNEGKREDADLSRGLSTPEEEGRLALDFLAPATRPEALGRLGHYEILEVLGRGGFGIVVRAFDEVLQRMVAIKVLSPTLATSSAARKRFLREARAAALVRHENVVQTYAVEEQPLPYLVMEFIPGETLQQRLDRAGPFDAAEVMAIGRQIAEGLAAAHAAGLIHRDVKPANVLIESGTRLRVKITDFGLARTVDDASLTHSGIVAGTPMYMSPEQAQGDTLDPRSDLFSLGSVLYAITSGKPPFRGGNTLAVLKRVAEDKARPLSEVTPNVPGWLCELIANLHAKAPDDRIQSATEIATLLAQGEKGATPSIPGVARASESRPWARWVGPGILGLAAAGLLAIILSPKDTRNHASSKDPALTAPSHAPADYRNALGMEFVTVPKGRFWMGGGKDMPGDVEVEIPYDFFLGKYEVTQEEWQKVMGNNPSAFSRSGRSKDAVSAVPNEDLERFPVEMVSWSEAQTFMEKLNEKAPDPDWVYRLPLEKEWEYACRGGPMTDRSESAFDFYFERPTNALGPDQANFKSEKELGRTCRVGSYPPNRLGLHDMHGNVNEWCEGIVGGVPFPQRIHRGGCWEFEESQCVARRPEKSLVPPEDHHNSLGLRVARVPRDVDDADASASWGVPQGKSPPQEPATWPSLQTDLDREAARLGLLIVADL